MTVRMESLNVTCPRSYNCTGKGDGNLVSFTIGVGPSYVSIFSCSLSCLGSILILVTFCALKDLRTTTQKIITFLAVADFVSAIGYIIGSVNFLTHFEKTDNSDCSVFQTLCKAQSTVTSWSSLVSFSWTVILAFHFFLIIVYRRFQIAAKLIPIFNIIAWGWPLLIVIPLLATDYLGYAPYAASNWCYIKDDLYSGLGDNLFAMTLMLVAGKGWEWLSYVIVALLYLLIFCHVHQTRRQLQNTEMESRVFQIEWRLTAIPVLFILLRIWGTVQFIVSLSLPHNPNGPCVSPQIQQAYLALGILQAIGDGGQGWGNAILYVLLSPGIRIRLCTMFCNPCMNALEDRLGGVLETDTGTVNQRPINRRVYDIKVNNHDDSSSPLVQHKPATGYNVQRYNSSTCSSGSNESYEYNRV